MSFNAEKYGPWAVIAGGSEGVGACFAKRLAGAGINLVLLARKSGPLEQVAREIRTESGVEVRTLPIDLTHPDMLDRIRAVTDTLDVGLLICNAGAANGSADFMERPAEEALKIIQLNVIGQTLLSHHFGGRMVQRGSGGILLVGSGGASAGCARLAAYSGAKAYLQIFGEALWAELRPKGVDVLVLMLGRTRTPALLRTDIADDPAMPAANPDVVAAFGLDSLTAGPVCAPPELEQRLQALRAMPRRQAVELMSAGMRGK